MSNELSVTLPARVSELRDLATMVEDFGDANNLPAPKVFAINLELDELITNTVTHGSFEAGIDPRIDIHLRVESDILILTMGEQRESVRTRPSTRTRTPRRHWSPVRWAALVSIWSRTSPTASPTSSWRARTV